MVEVRVAHEAEAAVLAVRRDGGVHRVERDVLDRVAERAAAAVAGRDVAFDFDHRHLSDERLGVAPVRVHVLHRVAAARAEGAYGRLGPRARRRELRGLAAARANGVPMPVTTAAREVVQSLIGNGYTEEDFAALLSLQAAASGMELKSEDKQISDGLSD